MGGIVAANTSGPRRRLYGSARDMVIGMTFATLEGKLIRTGGMVVKNVAGLDMGKLMIGSFGTLAAIATLNFRVYPMPAGNAHVRSGFRHRSADVMAARDEVLKSRLQPAAIDIVKSAGALSTRDPGRRKSGGSGSLLARAVRVCEWWKGPMRRRCGGAFANRRRCFSGRTRMAPCCVFPAVLSDVGRVLESLCRSSALARAGSGVCYGYFDDVRRFAAFHDGHQRGGVRAARFSRGRRSPNRDCGRSFHRSQETILR